MIFLRSTLFNAFFFISTFILTLPASVLAVVAPDRVMAWAKFWARLQVGALRLICGIRTNISGWDNLPPAPVVIASRHESTFDILIWIALLPAPCFVVKKELGDIPLFGRCIHATRMITVDRDAGGTAMRALLRGGDEAKRQGRHIVIFPEGTRADPSDHPPLQPGVVALASRMALPVVPVLTDSGRLWGRHAFSKPPGIIRVAIQPQLPLGYGRQAILDALRVAFSSGLPVDKPVSRPEAKL